MSHEPTWTTPSGYLAGGEGGGCFHIKPYRRGEIMTILQGSKEKADIRKTDDSPFEKKKKEKERDIV